MDESVTVPRKTQPFARGIHLQSGIWSYQVGKRYMRIRNPSCSRTIVVDLHVLLDLTPEDFERSKWKKTPAHQVTPSTVKEFIEGRLDQLL